MPSISTTTAARLAPLAMALMLIGCTRTTPLTVSTGAPLGVDSHAQPRAQLHTQLHVQLQAQPSERIFEELLALFTQPQAPRTVARSAPAAPGPQLVAGDWLAFQCAMVGGYGGFESQQHDTPAYAGASGLVMNSEQ